MSTNHPQGLHATLHSEEADHAHDVVGHHHHHKKHVKPKPGVNLNVTSMVDILFNLLVYFIVTASFVVDEGSLKAKMPPPPNPGTSKADELEAGDKKFLVVESTKDGYGCRLAFKGKQVNDFAALRQTLIANSTANGGKINPKLDSIMIQPNAKVRWQHVVNAFNQAVGAGYTKIGFGETGN